MPATAFSHIGQIASMRPVHEAFRWLHLHERQIMQWQMELVGIAAPPFAEETRARWLADRFRELGLKDVQLDSAGNVLGTLGSRGVRSGSRSDDRTRDPIEMADQILTQIHLPSRIAGEAPLVLLSAHIDTVFSAQTPLDPTLEDTRLHAPGACDNGAGVVALLALAAVLVRTAPELDCDIVFAGNVGEEGEGDLRGMRHIYECAPWRHRIAAHLVLDGAGHEVAVTGALGSRRFEVTIKGSGGHSWTDAGRPNPITALSVAIATMQGQGAQQRLNGDWADALLASAATPRSTWNVGTIEGGESVNAIPEQARARFDLRSTDAGQLIALEVELHRAIEDAVLAANSGERAHALTFTIDRIGSRPAGALGKDARILELLRSVDRHLNLRTEVRTASTDANIPLSLGFEALSVGAGGSGGGIHTRSEWYDAKGRDLGLRRVLLLLVALATSPS
jgi:acetylornithine deacetylase/succinyl-diaminopimelate desuccinylase-like protein